jgi:hypothetical protein
MGLSSQTLQAIQSTGLIYFAGDLIDEKNCRKSGNVKSSMKSGILAERTVGFSGHENQ